MFNPKKATMAYQGVTFNAHRLEHPYGVGFIDDIHNFFPELLYDAGLFTCPIVGFLQRRVNTLFEEDYSRNRTQYRMFQQARRRRESGVLTSAARLLTATVPITIPATIPVTTTTPLGSGTLGDVQSLFASLGLQGLTSLYTQMATPVPEEESPVPTEAHIQAATLTTSIDPPPDVECSICQDHAGPNNQTEWRILRHCNHRFHRSCIDTWFERNAHCPVCRHDIRDD